MIAVVSLDSELSESQQLVVDAFGAFFRRECTTSRVRDAATTLGFDAALWAALCELGGDRVSLESEGGDLVDAVLIGREAGRRLAPVPYVDVVAALRLAERLGLDVPSGTVTIVVENSSESSPAGAVAEAAIVLDGDRARLAHVKGAGWAPNLGSLPMGIPTVESTSQDVVADESARRAWREDVRLLTGALLVGAATQALDGVIDHVKNRHQFDRPIGAFQAVQHRLATCATALRAADLLVLRGACYPVGHPARSRFAAVAQAAAADAAEQAARESLQFFGGYGYSVEYDAHLYLRFVKAHRVLAGDGVVRDAVPALRWSPAAVA